MVTQILSALGVYKVCGCDACHWEVYDFYLFYFIKDWDVAEPKWTFWWRW